MHLGLSATGISVLLMIGSVSCSKESDERKVSSAKPDEGFEAAVLAQLKKEGLQLGQFETAASRPYSAKACVRGEMAQLDVLLCSYKDDAHADRAAKSLRGFVRGATTGAVRRSGKLLLAVADRDKKDLKGKQMNRLLASFSDLGG